MKNKKTPKKVSGFYSAKKKPLHKNKLPPDSLLYGMTPDQYNEGAKIHFKCFSQLTKVI